MLVEGLPSVYGAPFPAPHKLHVVVYLGNPSIQEVEASESGVQGHPPLHSNFEARLGYVKPDQKRKRKKKLLRGREMAR